VCLDVKLTWICRFCVVSEVPIHVSDSSIVFKVKDMQLGRHRTAASSSSQASESALAIKLFRYSLLQIFS
jgi:hypothetical protein